MINKTLSQSLPVFSGVFQGSVIGPLLFIIDIVLEFDARNNLNIFADDTKIFDQSKKNLQ